MALADEQTTSRRGDRSSPAAVPTNLPTLSGSKSSFHEHNASGQTLALSSSAEDLNRSSFNLQQLPTPTGETKFRRQPSQPTDTSDADEQDPGPDGPRSPMEEGEENFKPKDIRFWLIMLSNFLAMFLVALDRTIIATAIPRITDEFGSLGDIGWYGSAYMLTTAASQLFFGRIYKFYDAKLTYLVCIVIFEAGSVMCAAASNSPVFIVGRAIAGFGSAGIFTGSMMIMIPMVPLHKRPLFQAVFGMVFGFASVLGPLVGGAFTGNVSWRWCFWINLPVGGFALMAIIVFLKPQKPPQPPQQPSAKPVTLKDKVLRLDPLGTFFFLPSIVCLLLALQWGGSTYPWADIRIIILFVCFGVSFACFAAVQVLMPETATVPVRIIKQRTMLAGAFFMIFLAGSMMLAIYYVPLWFQTVKGEDPVKSGIYTIPLVLSIVVSSIISGIGTQKAGYYVPSMLLCPSIMAVGEGLLSTFQPNTSSAHWISYQFIAGFGLGFGMQTVNLAVQTVFKKEDVSTGIAISFFSQQLGAAIFVSVGQTLLSNLLIGRLSDVPDLDTTSILHSGATDLHKVVPEQYFGLVINAYNYALTRIFLAGMALCIVTLVCALCMPWRSIKKGRQGPPGGRTGADFTKPVEGPHEGAYKEKGAGAQTKETRDDGHSPV